MVYVVLTQNEFGLRDAWYVNGDNLEEALQEACAVMENVGIADPETFTILPSVENRAVPYIQHNILCRNPMEKDRTHIEPITFGQFCELAGFVSMPICWRNGFCYSWQEKSPENSMFSRLFDGAGNRT